MNKTKTKRTYLTPFFSVVLCLCFFINFTTQVEGASVAPSIFMQPENTNNYGYTQGSGDSLLLLNNMPNAASDASSVASTSENSGTSSQESVTSEENTPQSELPQDSQPTQELPDNQPDSLPESEAIVEEELVEADTLDAFEEAEPMAGNTIRVTNYTALKNVLEGSTTYAEIQLGGNISMGGGIAVNGAWTDILINGKDEYSGTTYQITDAATTTPQGTIYINNFTTQSITFQNVQIVGRNTYGTVATSDVSDVVISFQNVGFTGTKMADTRFGKVQLIDCKIIIQKNINDMREVAVAYEVEFGGNTVLSNTSYTTPYPMFTLADSGSGVTVLSGASVDITSMHYFGKYSEDGTTSFTVQDNARFVIRAFKGMNAPGTQFPLGAVSVGQNATLDITKTGNTSRPCITIQKSLNVNANGTLILRQEKNEAGAAVTFTATGARLGISNPKKVFMQASANTAAISYTGTATVTASTQVINTWAALPASFSDDLNNLPDNIWNHADGSTFTTRAVLGANKNVTNFISTWKGEATKWNAVLDKTTYNPATLNTIIFGSYLLDVPNGIEQKNPFVAGNADPNATIGIYNGAAVYTGKANSYGGFSITSNFTNAAIGTQIPILSSHDYIKAFRSFPVVQSGELKFGNVPSTLPFTAITIPARPMYVPRQETYWGLSIEDTRSFGSPWRLDASIDDTLLNDGKGHYLDGSINYLLGNNATPLTKEPLTIASGTASNNATTNLTWGENQGFLVWLNSISSIVPDVEYTTTIQWMLIDAP